MEWNRRDCRIKWNPITPQGANVHFKDYLLQVYSSAYTSAMADPGTGYTFQTYVSNPNFDFAYDLNKSVFGGLPQPKFFVQVKGRSIYDVLSTEWAFATAANHVPPQSPQNFQSQSGFRFIQFNWDYCTASDFSHWSVRSHEGTAAFGSWQSCDQNFVVMGLEDDSFAGQSVKLECKAVDLYMQESSSVSGSAYTMNAKTADGPAFQILPTDSKGSTLSALKSLYDGNLDDSYIEYTGGDWVQYEYPVEFVLNGSLLWANNNLNLYMGYYDENDEAWEYLAGSVGHGLSGGTLVEYLTQTAAQTNYYTTERDSAGKILMPFPLQRQFEKIKLFKYGGNNTRFYEWKNNVFIVADEIVAGRLYLRDGMVIASSPTGSRGAVFDDEGISLYKDGLRTLRLSASGNARFGAEGKAGVEVSETGSVNIDGDIFVGGLADIGNGHVRIMEEGIIVSEGNLYNVQPNDKALFLGMNNDITWCKYNQGYFIASDPTAFVSPTLTGASTPVWCVKTPFDDTHGAVITHASGGLKAVFRPFVDKGPFSVEFGSGILLDDYLYRASVESLSMTQALVVGAIEYDRVRYQKIGDINTYPYNVYPTASKQVTGFIAGYNFFDFVRMSTGSVMFAYTRDFGATGRYLAFRTLTGMDSSYTGTWSQQYTLNGTGSFNLDYVQIEKLTPTAAFCCYAGSLDVFGQRCNMAGSVGPWKYIATPTAIDYQTKWDMVALNPTTIAFVYFNIDGAANTYKVRLLNGITAGGFNLGTGYLPIGSPTAYAPYNITIGKITSNRLSVFSEGFDKVKFYTINHLTGTPSASDYFQIDANIYADSQKTGIPHLVFNEDRIVNFFSMEAGPPKWSKLLQDNFKGYAGFKMNSLFTNIVQWP